MLTQLFLVESSYAQYCNIATTNVAITPTTTNQISASYNSGRRAFNFVATAGCVYNFQTCGWASADTYLRLYSTGTGGTVLASGDDNCGAQSSITWTCPSNGTYSVLMTNYSCAALYSATRLSYTRISCPAAPPAPCASNNVNLNITAGTYPGEVSWTLVNPSGTTVASGGATYNQNLCLPTGCYTFNMVDSWGDGWNGANYTFTLGGTSIGTGTLVSGASGSAQIGVGTSCAPPSPTAPCTNAYAWGSLNAPTLPGSNLISSCTYQSDYNTIYSVVGGNQYQSSYNLGGYITVRHSSYNGTVVAHGNTPLTWTAPISGTYYIHYNTNNNCGTASSCGSSYIACLSCIAPSAPSNDLVCSATNISCGQTIAGTTVNATNSGTGENGSCGVAQSQSGVWYVVPGNGQTMTASLCATAWDSKISVFSGPNCSSLSCVGGNDDWGPACNSSSASYSWPSVVGQNYYILVHGYSANSAFSLNLSCVTPCSPPSNDLCANAPILDLGANNNQTHYGTGACSTPNLGTYKDVWVAFTVPCGGMNIAIDFCGSTPVHTNAYTNIFPNCSLNTWTGASNWNTTSCAGGNIKLFWNNVPAGTYYYPILIDPAWETNYVLNISGTPLYTPAVAPTSISGTTAVCAGQSTTLTLQGGSAGTNGVAQWFAGSCGSTVIGTGNSITVSPSANTTYFVRYAGSCNTTTCASTSVTVNPSISWANLQWPATATVNCGSGTNVYGQVYEAALTPAAGANNTIGVQIGVSSSNTNPSTWPAAAWTNASYNAQSGNNDEYVANIGSSLASGTYYYAFRYTTGANGCYVYGGYNASGGGYWNGSTHVNGVLTVGGIDWANLQFPGTGSVCQGQSYNVYGQVYEAGVTNSAGVTAGLIAEIGVSSANTNPSTWAANAWTPASFNAQSGNNDEFTAAISGLNTGTYYYTFRYKLSNACAYQYGGFNASGGGFWNGTTNLNGTLTVTPPPAANAGLDIIDPSTCGKNTINLAAAALTAGQSGQWSVLSATNNGGNLGLFSLAGTAANAQFTGVYGGTYVLQWALTSGGCTGTDQMTVTFNQPNASILGSNIVHLDLLWCGLTGTDWSTSTNWYQKINNDYVRMSGGAQPAITHEVFTVNQTNGGMCIGNNNPTLSISSNAEDVYVGPGITLNLTNDSLNIAGNLVNDGNLVAAIGTVNFTGSTNGFIGGTGNTQLFNMRINKSGGASLSLQQPVLVTNTLTMVQGNVNTTTTNLLTLGQNSSTSGNLVYGSGSIVGPLRRFYASSATSGDAGLFPVGTSAYNRYARINFTSSPGSNEYLTVRYVPGAPMSGGIPLYNGLPLMITGAMIQNYSADGYWQVDPTGGSYSSSIASTSYDVTLFANNLTGMTTPQICRIIKSPGSASSGSNHVVWQACGTPVAVATGAAPSSFAITSTASTGFSWFNIGSPNGQALPVELMSFSGNCADGQVNLEWQTASEHNSLYFEVEKSRDGENWQVLSTVPSAGNSTELLTYSAVDAHAGEGNNYYRLNQVDIDGANKVYDIINVSCSGGNKGYFSTYPNPSSGAFQVVLNNKEMLGAATLSIRDTKGASLLQRGIEVKPGINLFSINDLNLAPGVYYIQVINGDQTTEVIKEVIR